MSFQETKIICSPGQRVWSRFVTVITISLAKQRPVISQNKKKGIYKPFHLRLAAFCLQRAKLLTNKRTAHHDKDLRKNAHKSEPKEITTLLLRSFFLQKEFEEQRYVNWPKIVFAEQLFQDSNEHHFYE